MDNCQRRHSIVHDCIFVKPNWQLFCKILRIIYGHLTVYNLCFRRNTFAIKQLCNFPALENNCGYGIKRLHGDGDRPKERLEAVVFGAAGALLA